MCGCVLLLEVSWTGPVTLSPVPPQVWLCWKGKDRFNPQNNILHAFPHQHKDRENWGWSLDPNSLLRLLSCSTEIEDITQLFPQLCTHPSCRWFLYLHRAGRCNVQPPKPQKMLTVPLKHLYSDFPFPLILLLAAIFLTRELLPKDLLSLSLLMTRLTALSVCKLTFFFCFIFYPEASWFWQSHQKSIFCFKLPPVL